MTTHLNPTIPRATSRAAVPQPHNRNQTNTCHLFFAKERSCRFKITSNWRINAVSGGSESYLEMWKKAVERERKSVEFERIAEKSGEEEEESDIVEEELEKKSSEFEKLLAVPAEERDKAQKMQVIDRAAAAIAAARALLKENLKDSGEVRGDDEDEDLKDQREEMQKASSFSPKSESFSIGTPGSNFWDWAPPPDDDDLFGNNEIKPAKQSSPSSAQSAPVLERERAFDYLSIPLQSSMLQSKKNVPLPPLQSNMEVEKVEQESPHLEEENEVGVQFSANAAEAADALSKVNEAWAEGVDPDGSRWWTETGIERRLDGVLCKWTLTRGVSADKAVEWENKYWEAADELGYKELGSEKSGRDAAGNVWREYWRESMVQNEGVVHLEKTADKWGKNLQGDEWQEQWWEHYGASGTEKWAHKWCSIDPNTPVEDGHAHVWHERWGEKYDGQGGSTKYTDKWAERCEGDGWSKWGDKWDENFDPNGHGVKQGESWWEGKYGDRWNRTWGEGHNGSGWVHKYGKSSSGEHWDTHIQQDTWYERFPHYGFYHCFENSVPLREVKKPSEWSEDDPYV